MVESGSIKANNVLLKLTAEADMVHRLNQLKDAVNQNKPGDLAKVQHSQASSGDACKIIQDLAPASDLLGSDRLE
jgi:hypothetical protein